MDTLSFLSSIRCLCHPQTMSPHALSGDCLGVPNPRLNLFISKLFSALSPALHIYLSWLPCTMHYALCTNRQPHLGRRGKCRARLPNRASTLGRHADPSPRECSPEHHSRPFGRLEVFFVSLRGAKKLPPEITPATANLWSLRTVHICAIRLCHPQTCLGVPDLRIHPLDTRPRLSFLFVGSGLHLFALCAFAPLRENFILHPEPNMPISLPEAEPDTHCTRKQSYRERRTVP